LHKIIVLASNKFQNNQSSSNLNLINQMNNKAVAVFAAVLTGLQNVVATSREGRIASLLTFSEQAEEDV